MSNFPFLCAVFSWSYLITICKASHFCVRYAMCRKVGRETPPGTLRTSTERFRSGDVTMTTRTRLGLCWINVGNSHPTSSRRHVTVNLWWKNQTKAWICTNLGHLLPHEIVWVLIIIIKFPMSKLEIFPLTPMNRSKTGLKFCNTAYHSCFQVILCFSWQVLDLWPLSHSLHGATKGTAIWAAIPTHASRAVSVLRNSRCPKKPSVFACLS